MHAHLSDKFVCWDDQDSVHSDAGLMCIHTHYTHRRTDTRTRMSSEEKEVFELDTSTYKRTQVYRTAKAREILEGADAGRAEKWVNVDEKGFVSKRVLKEGDGAEKVKTMDVVSVYYSGKLEVR